VNAIFFYYIPNIINRCDRYYIRGTYFLYFRDTHYQDEKELVSRSKSSSLSETGFSWGRTGQSSVGSISIHFQSTSMSTLLVWIFAISKLGYYYQSRLRDLSLSTVGDNSDA